MSEFGISQAGFVATVWVFTAVATLLTLGRFAIRYVVLSKLFFDDIAHLLAYIFLVALSILYTIQASDSWRLARIFSGDEPQPPDDEFNDLQVRIMKYQFTLATLFWTCLFCVKFSFLGLYRLVLSGTGRSVKIWWGTVVIVILAYGACLSAVFTWCGPVSDLWNLEQCNSASVLYLANQTLEYGFTLNVFTDLLIMFIPLPMLWHLQMKRSQKIAVAVVFLLASVTLAFDILRIVETFTSGAQFTFLTLLYTSLETEVAVIVSALPTYRFLISSNGKGRATRRALMSRMTGTMHSSSNGSIPLEDQNSRFNGSATQMGHPTSSTHSDVPSVPKIMEGDYKET